MKKYFEWLWGISFAICWGTMPPSNVSRWIPSFAFWVSVIFFIAWKVVPDEDESKKD